MNAQEIIEITKRLPYGVYTKAMEIAMEYREKKLVYIPIHSNELLLPFMEMASSIWFGGYMAGVQAERRKRRSR